MSFTARLSSPLALRRVLAFDAVSGAATGGLHLLLAPELSAWLGLPEALLQASGVAILAFVALAGWLARQASPPRGPLMTIVLLNLAWAIACLWLAFGGAVDMTSLGLAYVLLQAAAVLVLAELEWMGLRGLISVDRQPLTA